MTTDIVPVKFNQDQLKLVRDTVAQNCTDSEFQLLLYQASTYGLDPLKHEIWAIKYDPGKPASIFAGRDGFLRIAHASGQFNGMESGVRMDGQDMIGWAKVYRKDMDHPFYVEVSGKEYNTGTRNWSKMPKTMIQKVAESQALRRAFSISGIYSQEEDGFARPELAQAPIIDADKAPALAGKFKKIPPKVIKDAGEWDR